MKIFGASVDTAACYYRVLAPFSVLRYRTMHEFEVGPITAAIPGGNYDVLWLQQQADSTTELIVSDIQAQGGIVVYDVDDWLFGLPSSWPCYEYWFQRGTGNPRERLLFHERLLRRADVVTTTTPYLAAKLEEHLGLEPGTVKVLPNCIVMGEWDVLPDTAQEFAGPVLGWFGTENHWDDWWDIALIVDEVLEELDGHLALIGAPELLSMFPERLAKRAWIHPLVRIRDFPKVRRLIKAFDVGLAWCTGRTESAKCRSPLKAIQYGAAGVPVVASETVYGELWEDCRAPGSPHVTGYGYLATLNNLGAVLREALSAARPAAQEMARAWKEEVWKNHSYEIQATRWLDVIEQARAGKAQS